MTGPDPDGTAAGGGVIAPGPPPDEPGPRAGGNQPLDADGRPLDADGQPRLGLFDLSGRAVPAVYLAAWIACLLGGGMIAISVLGSGNPSARWLFVIGLVPLALGLLAAAGSQATERARRPSLAFRGPSPVLAFGAVVALTLLAILATLLPLEALGVDPGGPLGTAVSVGVTSLVFIGVVRLLVVGPGALSWPEVGFSRTPAGALADLARGALLALPLLVVELAVLAALAGLMGGAASPLPPATSGAALALNLLSAAVLAPIGEEVFFRGYTTTAWARAAGARAAIVRGALFFSFAHIATLSASSFQAGLSAAVAQYLALLPVGLALGWAFLARRSIWVALGLHGAYNALLVLLAYAATLARG